MQSIGQKAIKVGSQVIMQWETMQQSSHRQFKNKTLKMIYGHNLMRKINYTNVVKKEIAEVRRVVDAVLENVNR